MADQPPNLGAGVDGAGDEDNVDQYFDDGGETFLPADHVSDFFALPRYVLTLTWLFHNLASDGKAPKRLDQVINGRAWTCRSVTPRKGGRSAQNSSGSWRDWCSAVWRPTLAGPHVNNFWAHPRQLQHRATIPHRGWKAARSPPTTVRSKKRGSRWAAKASAESLGRTQSTQSHAQTSRRIQRGHEERNCGYKKNNVQSRRKCR